MLCLHFLLLYTAPILLAHPFKPQSQPIENLHNMTAVKATLNLTTPDLEAPEHPVHCFNPTTSILPKADESDCNHIIQDVILRSPDLLKEQTFGFNPGVDVRLPQDASWTFGTCVIFVANGDTSATENLQLFDIAIAARRISEECLIESEAMIGGTSYIGERTLNFYVALGGVRREVQGSEEGVTVSKRSHDPQQESKLPENHIMSVERDLPRISSILASVNTTETLGVPPEHEVECFNPRGTSLSPATAVDCMFIINEYIVRLPNAMQYQTFGYTHLADIDLSNIKNRQWHFGQCLIFISSFNKEDEDVFRLIDIAITAQRIVQQCVIDSKEPIGGSASIGPHAGRFHVSVGGAELATELYNGTFLSPSQNDSDTVRDSRSKFELQ